MSLADASVADTAADGEIVTVSARPTRTRGRFVVSAGRNHLVSDTRASIGGPGEAITAGDLLLSALASCALALIHEHAETLGAVLEDVAVEASFQRNPDDPTRYRSIRIAVTVDGVDRTTAAALVQHFADRCPIYNTLRRGSDGNVTVALAEQPRSPTSVLT